MSSFRPLTYRQARFIRQLAEKLEIPEEEIQTKEEVTLLIFEKSSHYYESAPGMIFRITNAPPLRRIARRLQVRQIGTHRHISNSCVRMTANCKPCCETR
jgi:hypothetical protein